MNLGEGFFIANGADNDLPPMRERQGNPFYQFLNNLIPGSAVQNRVIFNVGDDPQKPARYSGYLDGTDGANQRIREIRRYEAIRAQANGEPVPQPPGLLGVAMEEAATVMGGAVAAVKTAISDALSKPKGMNRRQAAEWLRNVLADGAMAADDVATAAQVAGISQRTLDRARKLAGVEAIKVGNRGGWLLRLRVADVSPATVPPSQERQGE